MKSWQEIRDSESSDLNENRLIRKGLGLAFSSQSKTHGDNAVKKYNQMSQVLSGSVKDGDVDTRLERIEKSLVSLSEGLTDTRKQIGSLVSMVNVLILMNERTDQQMKMLNRRRR